MSSDAMDEHDSSSREIDERQPLLAAGRQVDVAVRKPSESRLRKFFNGVNSRSQKLYSSVVPKFDVSAPRYRWVPLLGCVIILFNEAEYMTKQVAVFRAIEAMHCIEYWQPRDPDIAALGKHIPERLCKDHSIQILVAQTSAWNLFGRMLCSMIGNIPLGYVADKLGRKVPLCLHKVNVMVSGALQLLVYFLYPRVPIWSIYFTGLPGLIGGNFDLGLAMLFASYTDVMPSELQRTTLFFLTTAMQYPPQAICPLLGGWLMDLDGKGGTPEVAMLVGFGSGAIAAALTFLFFPETKPKSAEVQEDPQHDPTKEDEPGRGRVGILYQKMKKSLQDTQKAVGGLGLVNVLLLALGLLTASIGIKSIDWFGLLQYPVVKLNWKFSQATTIVSTQAVITLINYAFLLPSYNRLGTTRYGFSASGTSLTIMLWSVVLLTSGSIVMGFADTVAIFLLGLLIYTLGTGVPVATQAYISVLIDKDRLARVLASLAVAQVGGKVLASALFPKVFAAGLKDGRRVMIGLPLFTGAALFATGGIAFVIVGATRPKRKEIVNDDEEDDALVDDGVTEVGTAPHEEHDEMHEHI